MIREILGEKVRYAVRSRTTGKWLQWVPSLLCFRWIQDWTERTLLTWGQATCEVHRRRTAVRVKVRRIRVGLRSGVG